MTKYNRLVADISSNNNEFNAHEYKQAGHVLVAIKASEGNGYVNPNHRGWCLHAGLHHIGVIHYHFARPDLGNNPIDEAQHFLAVTSGLRGPRDYLAVDIERATPYGWAHDPEWTRAFDTRVQQLTRYHTILYASRATLELPGEWLSSVNPRVWDADWSNHPDYAPLGYAVAFRQFTDGIIGPEPHALAGVGQCDVSYMSREVFAQAIREQP